MGRIVPVLLLVLVIAGAAAAAVEASVTPRCHNGKCSIDVGQVADLVIATPPPAPAAIAAASGDKITPVPDRNTSKRHRGRRCTPRPRR